MNEIYQKIIENAKDAIVIICDDVVEYINEYGAKKLGYKKEEIVGANFLSFVPEEERENLEKEYKSTIKGEESFLYETNFRTKNGRIIFSEIHAQKINYKGKIASLAFIRDITARKKTSEIFHQQEERFEAVTENTPDIIARYDEEGRYVYINAAGEKEFKITKKEAFWRTDEDLGINKERIKSLKEAIDLVFKNKKKKTFYSEGSAGDARKYYYTILVPEFFKDGDVSSALSITRDITEIREIDQAKSEFIGITSHQLRSPLSVINWCALSLLRGEEGELNEEEKDYVKRIYDSVRKLIKITDVFLNTTMLDLEMFVFNLQTTDVVEEAKKIANELTQAAKEKEIKFLTKYDKIPPIKIDKRALKIILRGLLSNAMEYSFSKGNVFFSIKRTSEEELTIFVGDDGCGINKEDQEKVFSRFYRAENARNMKAYGTGLDLYLIKSIIEKIEGDIRVESPNPHFKKGTLFSVKIPISFN